MSDSFKQAIIDLAKYKGIGIDENNLNIERPDLSAVSPWISVNDRLPEDDVVVTCLLANNETQECFILDGEWESVDVNYSDESVTHWAPKK